MDDILKEHSLAYIGYPERSTIKDKFLRTAFGVIILPIRLASTFYNKIKSTIFKSFDRSEIEESEEEDQVEIPKEEII